MFPEGVKQETGNNRNYVGIYWEIFLESKFSFHPNACLQVYSNVLAEDGAYADFTSGAKLAPFNSGVWQNCSAKTNDVLQHATCIIELPMPM